MKSTNILFIFLFIGFPILMDAQMDLSTNLFIRAPQVVNYNFDTKEISHATVLSAGAGITHRAKFIEFATFITDENVHGFYSFFGSTLKAKSLGDNWSAYTNWYGEFTYLPKQNEATSATQYASGICLFLNRGFEWGSIGFPLCLGLAYGNRDLILNTRSIVNVSINL